jgi:hypothetical protein
LASTADSKIRPSRADGAGAPGAIPVTEKPDSIQTGVSSGEFVSAAEALFEEARLRARRRRRRIAIGFSVASLAAGALIAVLIDEGRGPTKPSEPAPLVVRPERVLVRPPYMGVSCPRANSIACDRVGLAVYTPGSASSVRALIGGRAVELTDDPALVGPYRPGRPRMFVGFLHHAGLRHGALAVRVENGRNRWTGLHPVHAQVRLLITFRDHFREATSLNVPLQPGWG